MYSYEQDRTRYQQPCVADAGRSLQQLTAHHHHPGEQQALRTAAAPPVAGAGGALRTTRRAKTKNKPSSSSRRSSTTVVATDVSNFRAMVQELTGFPPAAIFRPLPRRVHAAGPFVAAGQAGQGCGDGGEQQHGRYGGYSEATVVGSSAGASSDYAPAAMPAVMAPLPGVFDGLSDIGCPEFDSSWGDLSME